MLHLLLNSLVHDPPLLQSPLLPPGGTWSPTYHTYMYMTVLGDIFPAKLLLGAPLSGWTLVFCKNCDQSVCLCAQIVISAKVCHIPSIILGTHSNLHTHSHTHK